MAGGTSGAPRRRPVDAAVQRYRMPRGGAACFGQGAIAQARGLPATNRGRPEHAGAGADPPFGRDMKIGAAGGPGRYFAAVRAGVRAQIGAQTVHLDHGHGVTVVDVGLADRHPARLDPRVLEAHRDQLLEQRLEQIDVGARRGPAGGDMAVHPVVVDAVGDARAGERAAMAEHLHRDQQPLRLAGRALPLVDPDLQLDREVFEGDPLVTGLRIPERRGAAHRTFPAIRLARSGSPTMAGSSGNPPDQAGGRHRRTGSAP